MQGTFPLPMKYAARWKWENIWCVFAFWGFVVLPWLLAFLTVPDLMSVYSSSSWKTLAAVTFFGAGWGIGTICFGIGISRVGLALGLALMNGMTAALGTLIPLIFFHPEAFHTSAGQTLLGGVALMLVGVCLCALAGKQKENAVRSARNPDGKENKRLGSFYKGLIVCAISGAASPMLNFAFAFGEEIVSRAKAAGASPAHASNPVWCWAMSSAFFTTVIYCLYLMGKDRGWNRYVLEGTAPYWGLTFAMGALWSGSIALYGMGLSNLGTLAASIGWPILMIATIVTGNLCGLVTGEWKGAGRKPLLTMTAGLAVLFIAICLIGIGNM
jgi:L-rhamnose-H+ transport protein